MPRAWWFLPVVGAAVLSLIGILWFTEIWRPSGEGPPARVSPRTAVPSEFTTGEALFGTYCTGCHGSAADGTERGPSLLWRIYAPNHHSDASVYQAVTRGVRAHHWRFGDMPPIPEVAQDEMAPIIAYVRWLQEQAGVR